MLENEIETLTPLETEALNLLLAGEYPALKQLREQLRHIVELKRTVTVVGFYLKFELASDVVILPGGPSFAISDVGGKIDGTMHGAGFILFVKAGRVHFLEGATFGGEKWPEQITHFKLGYDMGKRDQARLTVYR